MREIIFKTESKTYRWRPTKWQKCLYYGLGMALMAVAVYGAMFSVGLIEMGA